MSAECQEHRQRFSEYLDGELGEAERAALEAHVAQCAECRRELEAWRRTVAAVAGLPARGPVAGFADRVVQSLRRDVSPAEPRVVMLWWSRALPVAAMLLVVLGLVFTVERGGVPERAAEESQLAMARAPEREEALEAVAYEAARKVVAAAARRPVAMEAEEAPMRPDRDAWGMREKMPSAPAAPGPPLAGAPLGRAAGGPVAVKEETALGLALSWRGLGKAGEEARGRREEADELVFGQLGAAVPATLPGPVQQVMTLVGDDPAELARQAVTAANKSGVAATLSLRGDRAGGRMELYLIVPPERYDALLRELAALTSPENQSLANTVVATGEFFRFALADYEGHRKVRLGETEAAEDMAEKVALGGRAMARARGAPQEMKEAATALAASRAEVLDIGLREPAEPVNLLIRISRPAPPENE